MAVNRSQGVGVCDAATGPRILVIKLGALGDFVLTLGALRRIREYHAEADITLMTTAPLHELVEGSGLIDRVWLDERPRWHQVRRLLRLRRAWRAANFRRVYDLQNNDRTALYYRLCGGSTAAEWSGRVRGCSHPYAPPWPLTHAVDWPRAQLVAAGLGDPPPPALTWIDDEPGRFGTRPPFVLVAPGCAAHRPEKRWPAAAYGALCHALAEAGIQPVLVGTDTDRPATRAVAAACPNALDLTGRTRLTDLAGLAQHAAAAVGNDTGPMHLMAVAGCPTLVLFSGASDPQTCRPIGPAVAVLHRQPLDRLPVDEVAAGVNELRGARQARSPEEP